jgi:glyceraldehyde 3-phosphate dehydrogenase
MSIKIGINGLGRIGKCLLLQILNTNTNIIIKIINDILLNPYMKDIKEFEYFLKYDSTHKYNNNFTIEKLENNYIKLNDNIVEIFSEKNPENINWDCDIVIDCTGQPFYETYNKFILNKNIKYVMFTHIVKNMKTVIYGINDVINHINDSKIISLSSCTCNSIFPLLNIINDTYKIKFVNYTLVHKITGRNKVIDSTFIMNRKNRSIINNIIPVKTPEVEEEIYKVIPSLKDKIKSNTIRVNCTNSSLIDLNIQFENNILLENILTMIENHKLYNNTFYIEKYDLTSVDFVTTTIPTIIDYNSSEQMNESMIKLMIWFDNEWSYCSQIIKVLNDLVFSL